jgi:type VI secretion system protein ImpI
MRVRLKVTKETPPSWEHVSEIEKDIILIGRDPKNELPLGDKDSVVSRQHAKLVHQGNAYSIMDLNSRNGTLLNGDKIKPAIEYPLKNGDLINICEFSVEFSAEPSEIQPEENIPAISELPGFFAQESSQFVAALDQLCQVFEQEESPYKEELLREIVRAALEKATLNKAAEIIGQVLQFQTGSTVSFSGPGQEDQGMDISNSYDRAKRAMAILLDYFVKMVQALDQFELQFLDRTTIKSTRHSKSGKSFSIHNCTPKELGEHLFDPEISSREAQERLDHIQVNANQLMMHQLALLDGYKACVSEGTQQLLQRLSPQKVQQEVEKKTLKLGPLRVRYRRLPLFSALRTVKELKQAHQELAREDPATIENSYFRKPFMRGYENRSSY